MWVDPRLPCTGRGSDTLSPRHLTRLFSSELGTTPARWLESVRVHRACELLLEGHAVTATAQRAGFGSGETLRRAFDRQLGTTPSQYRARFAQAGTTHHP